MSDLRTIGSALLAGSMAASVVALISITSGFPRVWPGAILAFVSAAAAWLAVFAREGGERR